MLKNFEKYFIVQSLLPVKLFFRVKENVSKLKHTNKAQILNRNMVHIMCQVPTFNLPLVIMVDFALETI